MRPVISVFLEWIKRLDRGTVNSVESYFFKRRDSNLMMQLTNPLIVVRQLVMDLDPGRSTEAQMNHWLWTHRQTCIVHYFSWIVLKFAWLLVSQAWCYRVSLFFILSVKSLQIGRDTSLFDPTQLDPCQSIDLSRVFSPFLETKYYLSQRNSSETGPLLTNYSPNSLFVVQLQLLAIL